MVFPVPIISAPPIYKVVVVAPGAYKITVAQIILQGPKGEKGDDGAGGGVSQAEVDAAIAQGISDLIISALAGDPDFANTLFDLLSDKVDKVAGKQLSQENFTTVLKTKLDGLTSGGTLSKVYWDATGDEVVIPVTGFHLATVTDVRTNTSTLREVTTGSPGPGQYKKATNQILLGDPAGALDTYTILMFT